MCRQILVLQYSQCHYVIIAKNETNQKSSADERINKMWYSHALNCYSVTQGISVIDATTWINLKNINDECKRPDISSIMCSSTYGMSRVGTAIEIRSRLVVIRG